MKGTLCKSPFFPTFAHFCIARLAISDKGVLKITFGQEKTLLNSIAKFWIPEHETWSV
jgi:hypothetical protein